MSMTSKNSGSVTSRRRTSFTMYDDVNRIHHQQCGTESIPPIMTNATHLADCVCISKADDR